MFFGTFINNASSLNETPKIIIGVLFFILVLGGIYIFRKKV